MSMGSHWGERGLHRPCWPPHARGSATSQLAIGIFIMALGALLTLDRLQVMDVDGVLRFWPMALMVLGGALLARDPNPNGRFWGFAWLFVGAWLLLNTLGLVRVGIWQLFWPLVLVVIGVSLVRQAMVRGTTRAADGTVASGQADGGISRLFAAMSESKRSVVGEPFRGATMTALMGGCILDLRQAIIAPGGEAAIDVFAVMGGMEVVVPSAWTVVTEVSPVMASVDDKRLPAIPDNAAIPGQAAPRLVVRGLIIMSGLTLKS